MGCKPWAAAVRPRTHLVGPAGREGKNIHAAPRCFRFVSLHPSAVGESSAILLHPPSPSFSRCFNRGEEGGAAKWQPGRRLLEPFGNLPPDGSSWAHSTPWAMVGSCIGYRFPRILALQKAAGSLPTG